MKLCILGNNGPYPDRDGACSGYLLSSDDAHTNLLIECGTGVLARLAPKISFDALDAVVLSHLHFDHMSDMLPMQYALQFHPREAPLPVFAPESPASVRAMLDVPAYALRSMQAVQLGEMQLRFLPVRHPVETYALCVECDGKKFVYTGDTNEVEGLDAFATGADLLLADAGLSKAHWHENAPHLSAGGCGSLAQRAQVRRLLLTHRNPRYTEDALVAEARVHFACTEFAQMGETYRI